MTNNKEINQKVIKRKRKQLPSIANKANLYMR